MTPLTMRLLFAALFPIVRAMRPTRHRPTTILFFAFAASAWSAQQPEPLAPPIETTALPSAQPAVDVKARVEQASRTALEILQRLEGRQEPDALRAGFEEVKRHLQVVQTDDPANPWLPYLYGRGYMLTGRRADAIDQLRRFVETREGRNEWKAHRLLGDLFVEEFPRLAKASYRKAVALKADEPGVLAGLSLCAFKEGDPDEALRLARSAAHADEQRSVRYVAHLARMLTVKQQWVEAESTAVASLALAENEARAQSGSRDALQEVESQCKLLIDLLQAKVSAAAATGEDYQRMADYVRKRAEVGLKLSLHDALRALELGVNNTAPNTPPRLLEQYAVTLAEVGRTDDAIAAFEKLLTLEPSNSAAPVWLERLRSPQPIPPAPQNRKPLGRPADQLGSN